MRGSSVEERRGAERGRVIYAAESFGVRARVNYLVPFVYSACVSNRGRGRGRGRGGAPHIKCNGNQKPRDK